MYKHGMLVKPLRIFGNHLPELRKRIVRCLKHFDFIPVIVVRAVMILKGLLAIFILHPVQAAAASFCADIEIQFLLHDVKKKNRTIEVFGELINVVKSLTSQVVLKYFKVISAQELNEKHDGFRVDDALMI